MLKDYIKEKNWIFEDADGETAKKISEKYFLPQCVASVAANRADGDICAYLEPDASLLCDPFCLDGMKEAVSVIKDAVKNMKTIIVYGDYDVDGITSTYILMHYLKSIGALVSYYIPSRTDEGYGLNERALIDLKQKGADLVITVDLGITAKDEAKLCKNIGLDLIITDHHLPIEDKLPADTITINPKISKNYPFKNLAGAGVAFKLVCALSDNNKNISDYYIPFCAIGTIADLVELCGENRFIAKYGLKELEKTKNIGLLSLFKAAKIKKDGITTSAVSFGIAPRLNAAGRLSNADMSVELLMSCDEFEAGKYANLLEDENTKRKQEEQIIFKCADEIIKSNNLSEKNVIVVAQKNWHHGVIGIVSSKITEKYYKPSVVISLDDDGNGKASGRSIPGFDLFCALKSCGGVLEKCGGHSLAAGLSVKEENIKIFDKMINEYAKSVMTEEILTPKIFIDSVISVSDVNLKNAYALRITEPYGIKNPQAVFCIKNAKISHIRNMADKPHSFVTLSDESGNLTFPAFGLKDKILCFAEGEFVDICGSLNVNVYNGNESAQFIIRDIRAARKRFISKDDLRKLYIFIKNSGKEYFDVSIVSDSLKSGSLKFYRMLKILKELDMIDFSLDGDKFRIEKKQDFYKKTGLSKSAEFNIYSE